MNNLKKELLLKVDYELVNTKLPYMKDLYDMFKNELNRTRYRDFIMQYPNIVLIISHCLEEELIKQSQQEMWDRL